MFVSGDLRAVYGKTDLPYYDGDCIFPIIVTPPSLLPNSGGNPVQSDTAVDDPTMSNNGTWGTAGTGALLMCPRVWNPYAYDLDTQVSSDLAPTNLRIHLISPLAKYKGDTNLSHWPPVSQTGWILTATPWQLCPRAVSSHRAAVDRAADVHRGCTDTRESHPRGHHQLRPLPCAVDLGRLHCAEFQQRPDPYRDRARRRPLAFAHAHPAGKAPSAPGLLVAKLPNMAMWRIQFTYSTDKPPVKGDGAEKPTAPEKVDDGTILPPRAVTITRTHPYAHVMMVDMANRTSELWSDGDSSYLQTPGHSAPYLPGLTAGGGPAIPTYLDYSHSDFPDVGWVSPQTYLGVLKGTSADFLLFRQGEKGPTVWIDPDARRPVQWQDAAETRKFVYLDAPTEKLQLPPAVIQASKSIHKIDEVTAHHPPRGS